MLICAFLSQIEVVVSLLPASIYAAIARVCIEVVFLFVCDL
jgi:hypothetical protein